MIWTGHVMKISALVIANLALVTAAVWSQEPPVTKIVVRASGPRIPADSFAAKPVTFYLAGELYGRVEEEVDREHGVHPLFINSAPDTWIVNLANKTAQHVVDHQPPFSFHAPILFVPKAKDRPEANAEFKELNFGTEVQFFREQSARDLGQRKVDGKECNAFSLTKGSIEVTLFVDSVTNQPSQLDIIRDGKLDRSYRYLEYKTNLPFQKSLFEPPDGVRVRDAN